MMANNSQIFAQYPDVVTVDQLAAMLKIGRNSAYELIHCGAIPGIRIGRIIRISKQAVIDYLTVKTDRGG